MSEPGARYVCDLTWIMRTRLLCGLYSRRAVPPRWRRLAQAYCLSMAVAYVINFVVFLRDSATSLYPAFLTFEYLFGTLISLWTGGEYIYSYYTLNEMTDVTLDARTIFDGFQKRMKQGYSVTLFLAIVYFGASIVAWYEFGFVIFITRALPGMFHELLNISVATSKLLVMWLFNARMLVLKRRLQRYGFRTVGRAPPQPYCQAFEQILQGLSATDNPLKFLLFFDLIFGCCKIISLIINAVHQVNMTYSFTGNMFYFITVSKILFIVFGHVALLEAAAEHAEDMALFTVTELIKNPTAAERRRMHDFLRALERRGARYQVLRALPLNARLVLRVLEFCSAQIVVFVNTIRGN